MVEPFLKDRIAANYDTSFTEITHVSVKVWNADKSKAEMAEAKKRLKRKAIDLAEKLINKNKNKRKRNPISLIKRDYSTTVKDMATLHNTSGQISKPIIAPRPFATYDIETVTMNDSGLQLPISISFAYAQGSKVFLINSKATDLNRASEAMFFEFFDYLNNLTNNILIDLPSTAVSSPYNKEIKILETKFTIFAHNAGKFDALFIYLMLLRYTIKKRDYGAVNPIVDDSKAFILIS
jgi:hypothetical protein